MKKRLDMNDKKVKIGLIIIALALSGIVPNLFPLVESGRGELSTLAIRYFIPSALLTLLLAFSGPGRLSVLFTVCYSARGKFGRAFYMACS